MPVAVLGALAPVTVGLAGILPASWVADKRVESAEGVSRDVATPYALVPAAAESVDDRVSFGQLDGLAERDASHPGGIYFVSVTEPPQSILSWFAGHDSHAVHWMTYDERFPGAQSETQQRTISLQMMRTASQVAQYLALHRLGFDATIVPGDVVVSQFVCQETVEGTCTEMPPAADVLQIGDTITAVDGRPIATVEDLGQVLAGHAPGDVVAVTVRHFQDEREVELEVPLISAGEEPDRTVIGFVPFDTASIDLPFELTIDTGEIGGPSAGLAFTLTLIDDLSAGDLTGGQRIVVTGTIDLDGTVGAIGGLTQKAVAAQQSGAAAFLVPATQNDIDQARQATGGDLEIVPVATLDEALAALERLGGDPVEPVEP